MNIRFRETTLDNGLRVATAEMPHVQSVSLGIWVGVGGRYESRRASGFSHFIEHMLFKGTRTRSARDISQAIEGRGGYFNAFTQEESTCYYARIAATHAWEAFDVLADMYMRPRMAEADVDKERGVVMEEIMMYRDRPSSAVEDRLGELLWTGHSLGRPLIGTPENIARVRRQDLVKFKQAKYVPGNTVVTFAGRVDHAACVRHVRRTMGRSRPRPTPRHAPVSRGTPQEACDVQTREVEQSHLAMGIRLFGRHDARRYALKLLSVVLGENMSSRLFQCVRERHGLAYAIQSSVHLFEETGALAIQAGLDKDRAAKTLKLTLDELGRLKDRLVQPRELRRAKDYAIGQLQLGLETTSSQMMWVGENLMGYGTFTQPAHVVQRLEKVTAEEIRELARKVLRRKAVSVAMIVPADAEEHRTMVMEQLERL